MDRRNFLRSMLGVAAATALPSEVWPFKKIFLPLAPRITRVDMLDLSQWGMAYYCPELPPYGDFLGLSRSVYPGRLSITICPKDIPIEARIMS
jgi:hypothetical protein